MDTVESLLETIKDLLEIFVLVLTATQLLKDDDKKD